MPKTQYRGKRIRSEAQAVRQWNEAERLAHETGHTSDPTYGPMLNNFKRSGGSGQLGDPKKKEMPVYPKEVAQDRSRMTTHYVPMPMSRKSIRTDDLKPHGGVPSERVYSSLRDQYPRSLIGWARNNEWHWVPNVPLSDIKLGRRPGGRNEAKVEGIRQAMTSGEHLGPVILCGSPPYTVVDGYHRLLAAKRNGMKTIGAVVGNAPNDLQDVRNMHLTTAAKSLPLEQIIERIADLQRRVLGGHLD